MPYSCLWRRHSRLARPLDGLRLPYSKFGTGGGVNSRAGLTLAYATPICVYIALWIEGGANTVHLVVLAAFLFHFVRRILEILFFNSYSRPTLLCALVTIALLHGGAATSCAFFQVHTLEQPTSNLIFMLGVLVFAFGELLNGYHHWLLADDVPAALLSPNSQATPLC